MDNYLHVVMVLAIVKPTPVLGSWYPRQQSGSVHYLNLGRFNRRRDSQAWTRSAPVGLNFYIQNRKTFPTRNIHMPWIDINSRSRQYRTGSTSVANSEVFWPFHSKVGYSGSYPDDAATNAHPDSIWSHKRTRDGSTWTTAEHVGSGWRGPSTSSGSDVVVLTKSTWDNVNSHRDTARSRATGRSSWFDSKVGAGLSSIDADARVSSIWSDANVGSPWLDSSVQFSADMVDTTVTSEPTTSSWNSPSKKSNVRERTPNLSKLTERFVDPLCDPAIVHRDSSVFNRFVNQKTTMQDGHGFRAHKPSHHVETSPSLNRHERITQPFKGRGNVQQSVQSTERQGTGNTKHTFTLSEVISESSMSWLKSTLNPNVPIAETSTTVSPLRQPTKASAQSVPSVEVLTMLSTPNKITVKVPIFMSAQNELTDSNVSATPSQPTVEIPTVLPTPSDPIGELPTDASTLIYPIGDVRTGVPTLNDSIGEVSTIVSTLSDPNIAIPTVLSTPDGATVETSTALSTPSGSTDDVSVSSTPSVSTALSTPSGSTDDVSVSSTPSGSTDDVSVSSTPSGSTDDVSVSSTPSGSTALSTPSGSTDDVSVSSAPFIVAGKNDNISRQLNRTEQSLTQSTPVQTTKNPSTSGINVQFEGRFNNHSSEGQTRSTGATRWTNTESRPSQNTSVNDETTPPAVRRMGPRGRLIVFESNRRTSNTTVGMGENETPKLNLDQWPFMANRLRELEERIRRGRRRRVNEAKPGNLATGSEMVLTSN